MSQHVPGIIATPFGFVRLLEAVGAVEAKVGNREIAIRTVAEACECGKLKSGYLSISASVDDLDSKIWQIPQWRVFEKGTIELDLPLLDLDDQPNAHGFTARCERDVFVRRDGLDVLMAGLAPVVESAGFPGDAALIEEGRRMLAAGKKKRPIARELAARAEGASTFESKVDRLRRLL